MAKNSDTSGSHSTHMQTNAGGGKIDKRKEDRHTHTPHFTSRADNRSKTQLVDE